ncbi:hypothetical protein ACS0TY_003582 [Phlomoides rotata]
MTSFGFDNEIRIAFRRLQFVVFPIESGTASSVPGLVILPEEVQDHNTFAMRYLIADTATMSKEEFNRSYRSNHVLLLSLIRTTAMGLFEGLKAYRKHDGNILLFCPEENAMRLRVGIERMCMPAPTVEQFVEAVKATVLANERWVQKQSRFDSFVNQNNSNAASQNALDVVNAMLDADPSSARIVRKNCKTALHTTVRIISFYDLETVKIRAKSDMNAFHGTARTLFICHLWEPTSDSTWNIDFKPFVGHTASVEDLQWSPTEQHVFTSCSVDGNIAFWDIHLGKSSAVSIKAHDADVNVITWNSLVSCMLASGSDDGTFSIRDQRLLKEADSVVARFDYHKHPITSIEWSPHEASTLAVTSSDNQLTVWDLSLERDEEEEAEFKAKTKEQVNAPTDLPQQLLFVHQRNPQFELQQTKKRVIPSSLAVAYTIKFEYRIKKGLCSWQRHEWLISLMMEILTNLLVKNKI